MSEPARQVIATTESVPADGTERILSRIRLLAKRRAAWLRELWRMEGAGAGSGDRSAVTHAAADTALEAWDTEEAERAWRRTSVEAQALGASLAAVEGAMAADRRGRMAQLEALFGLDGPESDLLQLCFAAAIDSSLARVLAYLQDHAGRAYPTEELVARLFQHGRRRVLLPESPLRRWSLVTEESVAPGEPRVLGCDPLIRGWLLGESHLDEALVGTARLARPLPPLPRWPLEQVAARISAALDGEGGEVPGDGRPGRVRVRVVGLPGSGRRTFAACVAQRLGLPLLVVDTDRIDETEWPRLFARAQRQAFLDRSAIAWVGDAATDRGWPDTIVPFPLQFVLAEPLVGKGAQAPTGRSSQAIAQSAVEELVELPLPLVAERESLWRALVPGSGAWPPEELTALAARHRMTVAEIAALGRRRPAHVVEASSLVREASRHRMGDLATFVDCPFGWEDLVVPDALRATLGDLVYESGARAQLWEESAPRRLFPQGQGLFALFSGPPGTGKTMAAQVIAAELGLDLFRISLATVVSKYVGETSKNLQSILARAERMDAVLLFDEADALFGKRTEIKDAHDRFANTDTNYLLQAIEAYRGVALLATNKKANIDPAFVRRLRYLVEFPKPDAQDRRRLWGRLVTELAGADRAAALTLELDMLARTVEATGAQIKYAVLAALFAARRQSGVLGLRHLLAGLDRELLKEGSAIDRNERERMMGMAGARAATTPEHDHEV